MYDVLDPSWPMEENKTGSNEIDQLKIGNVCESYTFGFLVDSIVREFPRNFRWFGLTDGCRGGGYYYVYMYIRPKGGGLADATVKESPETAVIHMSTTSAAGVWNCDGSVTFSWLDSAASRRMDGLFQIIRLLPYFWDFCPLHRSSLAAFASVKLHGSSLTVVGRRKLNLIRIN